METTPPPPGAPLVSVPCNACGAQMTYSAEKGKLDCAFCGNEQDLPRDADLIVENDFTEALKLEQAGQGLGTDTHSLSCKNCGAITLFAATDPAPRCSFCDSRNVNVDAYNQLPITPAGIMPFSVPEKKAKELFTEWLGSGWFRPNDLAKVARLGKLDGVYIPFWTYDAHTDSSWTAEAGYHYYETESYTDENGNTQTRQVQRTRWVPAAGYYQHWFDDVLVVGSKGVKQRMVERAYPYDLKDVVNYEPRYILGWQAEVYGVDVQGGFGTAEKIMDEHIRSACAAMIPGDTYRNLMVHTRKYDITFKHILLPLWIAAYQYGGDTFQALVNGQTGKVAGDKPVSWWKVALVVLLVIAIIAAIIVFTRK